MRFSRMRRLLAGGVLVGAALVPAAAWSAGTLDQEAPRSSTAVGFIGPNHSKGQTFTAGLSGQLDQVDLPLSRPSSTTADLSVEIRNAVSGLPSSTVLASATVSAASVKVGAFDTDWVSVSFSSPPAVMAGSQYAIVAHTGGAGELGNTYNWSASSADYSGGTAAFSPASPPSTWTDHSTSGGPVTDFGFRTYVADPPPPLCNGLEPTILGTAGNDTLIGTSGVDVIAGLGGNDTIKGGSGNDVICGGDGNDTIDGGSGHDQLYGDADDDTLKGGSNNDTLDGGDGADKLAGGSDRDHLTGGPGSPDTCNGGSGRDSGGDGCESTRSIP